MSKSTKLLSCPRCKGKAVDMIDDFFGCNTVGCGNMQCDYPYIADGRNQRHAAMRWNLHAVFEMILMIFARRAGKG